MSFHVAMLALCSWLSSWTSSKWFAFPYSISNLILKTAIILRTWTNFSCPFVLELWSYFELENGPLWINSVCTWPVREDGQSTGSSDAAFVPNVVSLGPSEVEGTEGVLEVAEVIISVNGLRLDLNISKVHLKREECYSYYIKMMIPGKKWKT